MAKIGSMLIKTVSDGIIKVPVYETGDSGSEVYEFLRVKTELRTGFIPVANISNARYPFIRVLSENNGVVALTDNYKVMSSNIIDDFEQNNLDNYDLRLINAENDSHIVSSPVYEGNYALGAENVDRNGGSRIASTSGLDNYPSEGDTFEVWMRPDRSNNYLFVFGVDETDSYKGSFINPDIRSSGSEVLRGGGFQLDGGGSYSSYSNNLPNIQSQKWYKFKISWFGDSKTVRMYDSNGNILGSLVYDHNTTGNGIGFRFGLGGTCYVDRVKILNSTVYDFATQDLTRWDNADRLIIDNSRVHSGAYSGYVNDEPDIGQAVASTAVEGYKNGGQPSGFGYFWNEDTTSGGCGVKLLDSEGNVVCGAATNNPEWIILDDDGEFENSSSDGYNRWINTEINFNWDESAFNIRFKDLNSGKTYSRKSRPIINSRNDIARIELHTYGNGGFSDGSSIKSWFDNIYFFE